MAVILTILLLLAMLAMTGTIVYFSVGHAVRANKQYELFAQKYGYNLIKHKGIFIIVITLKIIRIW